ncbi:conserved hypothetical protein [Chlamydia felis Fe/C-56]|uniref:Uncharacterized protein n=1 Tax=Chlamydia felis (strain Fe/C-56) TaxID=264202 RepID=Q254I8_CHLFF|nr:hypothetical protein [Chlamydia felis]BAE81300.1 conserved hypothetical protein [Chlamydia felis Fe/C-56]
MDVFSRLNCRDSFYVEQIDGVMKDPRSFDDNNNKKGNELKKKLLTITKRVVASAQEFQRGREEACNYLKKTQWMPYKNEELEETKELFSLLTSIERKLAQLFFFVPSCGLEGDDFITAVVQLEHSCGLGGVLFSCGSFEKQCRYIRDFNKSQTIPLLLGCSVSHSLQFYLSYQDLSLMDCKNLYDLGMGLGKLLKDYGVVISLIYKEIVDMDMNNYSEFVRGVKHAGSIQGKLHHCDFASTTTTPLPIALRYSLANTIRGLAIDVDFSSIKFIGCSILANVENTIKALNYGVDCFTFSNLKELKEGIKTLAQLISAGKISPAIVNKSVIKVLTLKRRFKSVYV